MTTQIPFEIVIEYRMSVPRNHTLVMVEGPTDEVLWTGYKKDCELLPAPEGKGKDYIIEVLKIARLLNRLGIAAIVDADYWLITQSNELQIANLLYDGCCPDVELILLNSPALEKALLNIPYFYNKTKQIHEFAEKLKEESLRLAAELGYFRLLNHIEDYGISFKEIDYDEFIKNTLESNREWRKWFAKRLTEHKPWLSSEALLKEIEELREKYPQEEYNIQLCRGKDVINIMVYILPILFKSQFGDDLPQSILNMELTAYLRMSYEYGDFEKTSLFSSIREWESNNTPYRIIRRGWTNHAQT